jgi:hypothetical protein
MGSAIAVPANQIQKITILQIICLNEEVIECRRCQH